MVLNKKYKGWTTKTHVGNKVISYSYVIDVFNEGEYFEYEI